MVVGTVVVGAVVVIFAPAERQGAAGHHVVDSESTRAAETSIARSSRCR
tara:strand:- start:254 stop:400 length:147 start_codon:yes stop_codon:yes gene_type:complete